MARNQPQRIGSWRGTGPTAPSPCGGLDPSRNVGGSRLLGRLGTRVDWTAGIQSWWNSASAPLSRPTLLESCRPAIQPTHQAQRLMARESRLDRATRCSGSYRRWRAVPGLDALDDVGEDIANGRAHQGEQYDQAEGHDDEDDLKIAKHQPCRRHPVPA